MKEALKLALDALEESWHLTPKPDYVRAAITTIKAALAQPTSGDYALGYVEGFNDACKPKPAQQEPVAWMREDGTLRFAEGKVFAVNQPLYTTPPQRTWVDLTFAEICECENDYLHLFARAVEVKLKAKNGFPQEEKNT